MDVYHHDCPLESRKIMVMNKFRLWNDDSRLAFFFDNLDFINTVNNNPVEKFIDIII